MKLGYNTNGLAFHRWQDALDLIADAGFRSVAITVDHGFLNPFGDRLAEETESVGRRIERLGLSSVIETGARFLLDPRTKHEPTLVSATPEARTVRFDFLCRCVEIARQLESECLSFWSGSLRDTADNDNAWHWLVDACRRLADYAGARGVRLAFEPEPGMLVARMADFDRLWAEVGRPDFGLTLDLGHVHCLGDGPIDECVRKYSDRLYNVHIEDMRRGIHEHLRFGEGEIEFAPVLAALRECGYAGGVHVELSRHSHIAPEVLAESFQFLNSLLQRNAAR